MSTDRQERIVKCLETHFAPEKLQVKDQTHLHAGHAGAATGLGHFDVTIVAAAFADKSRLQRHRMVYDALAKLLESDIHALRIKALAPSER